jgi:hypothetical protein
MDFLTLLLVASILGLGPVVAWIISGKNLQYTGLVGSVLQGIIGTPFLAVGGVAAFLLFAHFMGVTDVQHVGTSGLMDVLTLVGGAGVLGGVFLGLGGFLMSRIFD